MTEEEHYEEVDLLDIVEHSAQYQQDDQNTEQSDYLQIDTDPNSIHESDVPNSEDHIVDEKRPQNQNRSEVIRTTRLPIARIKNIMKMDPDVNVVSADAVFLVTKATELFLETIAKETYSYTSSNKRKIIAKKDIDLIINKVDCLCFLEGAMDF